MSREEARAHLRAAQEAEIAGNKEAAVRHLERAALEYVRTRQHKRAVAMYEHCLRLAPGRDDLREALRKAQAWAAEAADEPVATLTPSPELARAMAEAAGEPVDEAPAPARPAARAVVGTDGFDALAIQRGPTRTPADVDAWCSFCCRPMRETGPLAQGPAGAFICVSCLEASGRLLGAGPAPAAAPAAPVTPARVVPRTWVGPAAVRELAKAALLGKAGPLVVTGPAGSGKSALLAELAAMFPGALRVDLARGEPLPGGTEPLLVDHLEAGANARWAALEGRPFVAALRGAFEVRPLAIKAGEQALELPVAQAELPAGFPAAAAVALPEPSAELLGELLERAAAQEPPLSLAPALKEALVARALKAGRGAHALLAEASLLRGLGEPGVLDAGEAPKKGRRRKP